MIMSRLITVARAVALCAAALISACSSAEGGQGESESAATGTYNRTVPPTNGYSASASGTIVESGSNNNDSHMSAAYSVANGFWGRDSGSGSGASLMLSASEYSGSGTYSLSGPFSSQIAGDLTESGGSDQNTNSHTASNVVNGGWVTTGNSIQTGSNHALSAYSGSGSIDSTPAGSGGSGNPLTGTAFNSGDSHDGSGFTLNSALDASGNWVAVSGSASGAGGRNANIHYSASGAYSAGAVRQFNRLVRPTIPRP